MDGAEEQREALKGKLKKMRKSKDPKRKGRYFNSKMLLGGSATPANTPYRAFLARYAHYVLLRVRCFGGLFTEIAEAPKQPKPPSSKSRSKSRKSTPPPPKPSAITLNRLKKSHLDAARLVLKSGLTCKLKSDETCENTAIAMETVVQDMIGLTAAVATALNSALKNTKGAEDLVVDEMLIQQWAEFYAKELLPQTKAMMKSATPTLDAYDIFLPSRIGVSVNQELLRKGLAFGMAPVESNEESGEEDGKEEEAGNRDG